MTLFLVLLVVAVLFLAGASQSFVTHDVKKRVRASLVERIALVQATNATELGAAQVAARAAAPVPGDEDGLGAQLRRLGPGEVATLEVDFPFLPGTTGGVEVRLEGSRVRAWLLEAEAGAGEVDCDARVPGVSPAQGAMIPARLRRLPQGVSPARLHGVVELEAVSRADAWGHSMRARARLRRPFLMELPPCGEEDAADRGETFPSRVEVLPVELMRSVEVWRAAGPAGEAAR